LDSRRTAFDFELANTNIDILTIEDTVNLIPMIINLEETVEDLQNYTVTNGDNQNRFRFHF
jgi:hypothetical protein